MKLSIVLVLFGVPAALVVARPSLVTFDPQSQECRYEGGMPVVQIGLGLLIVLTVLSVALTVRLRLTHVQVWCECRKSMRRH